MYSKTCSVRESGEEYHEMMIRSCDLDYAFDDVEPMEKLSQYSIASSPIYRGGEVQNESRNNSGAMAGSGSVQWGPGSARPADGQDLQPYSTPGRSRTGAEYKPSIISSDRLAEVGGSGSVQSEPVHPSLVTPRILQSDVTPSRRVLDLDTSGFIDEIISRLSVEGLGNNDQAEQWFKLMKH